VKLLIASSKALYSWHHQSFSKTRGGSQPSTWSCVYVCSFTWLLGIYFVINCCKNRNPYWAKQRNWLNALTIRWIFQVFGGVHLLLAREPDCLGSHEIVMGVWHRKEKGSWKSLEVISKKYMQIWLKDRRSVPSGCWEKRYET